MTLGLLFGHGKQAATRAAPLALSFVQGLPSLCSFAQAAVSAAWHALSRSILRFLFSSIVCMVIRRPLQQCKSAISTTPEVTDHASKDS